MSRTTLAAVMLAIAWGGSHGNATTPQNDASEILNRIQRDAQETEWLTNAAYHNPVINQFRKPYSLNTVGISFNARSENHALNQQQGDSERLGAFDAQSYMKHGNSTLWGHAYYHNGSVRNVVWNETSDYDMVYPYLLADSVGGKKTSIERYSFMGGYAAKSGHWAWGGNMGYTAGLYYRNVDPRPKNVTALLDLQAGLGYQATRRYVAAASVNFKKYKQTNDVAFYSELGKDKLFHLTGFANEYDRFAGAGSEAYYNGHSLGATLNWHPLDYRGLSISAEASRLTLNKVLTAFNKLPLAHVGHNTLLVQAAWIGKGWGLNAHATASRKVGTENVFGDPTSGIYLQIGRHDLYFENRFSTGISGVWQHGMGNYYLAVRPHVDYHHLHQLYLDPLNCLLLNDVNFGVTLKGGLKVCRTFNVLTIGMSHTAPVECAMTLHKAPAELAGLQRLVENGYEWQSSHREVLKVTACSSIALNTRYALRANIDWQHGRYRHDTYRNTFFTSLALVF